VGTQPANGTLFLMGTDSKGRDVLSRVIFGARVSLSVSLVGTALSLLLGIFLGGLSGYFGGWIDMLVQRLIELLQSLPTLPLWMGLAAAIPLTWDPLTVYFLITVILSLITWTKMAREVRGRFLAMREEDFVMAAKLLGAGDLRVILRHMVPSFLSHIIAVTTLTIPELILSETALRFIGLGLRPPVVSWGVLLQDAQNVSSVALAPWLLMPALFLILTVVAFNFVGDGLRDAADPYVR
jgi:peptide/nickel transport system permease protein